MRITWSVGYRKHKHVLIRQTDTLSKLTIVNTENTMKAKVFYECDFVMAIVDEFFIEQHNRVIPLHHHISTNDY